MKWFLWTAIVLWPALGLAQWVQIGFLPNENPACRPSSIVITDEQRLWQRELILRGRDDFSAGWVMTEPIVLPRNASFATYAVYWKIGTTEYTRSFKAIDSGPVQVLLNQQIAGLDAVEDRAEAEPVLSLGPNPFNPSTSITLKVFEAAHLRLEVFDILGRSVALLHNSDLSTGTHRWIADGSSWASGAYFLSYRLSSGQSGIRRMQLLK